MAVEARVAEFGDLLGKKFDTVGGVAEDDGLVDLELGKQGVQAVNLLLLLNKRIVLSDTAKGKLVHEVDLVRASHVLVRKVLDREREGGGEQHDLTILGVELQELLNDGGEFLRQQLISLVHDEHWALAEISHLLASQIEDTAWCSDDDVYGILQTHDVVPQTSTTGCHHDIDAEMLAERLADLRCLHGKLTGGDENETLDLGDLGVDLLEGGDKESGSLAGTVLGASEDVSAGEGDGDRLFLNWGWFLEASLEDTHQEISVVNEILPLQTPRVCDIFGLVSCVLGG